MVPMKKVAHTEQTLGFEEKLDKITVFTNQIQSAQFLVI
jgi:hypothetical protein